ncbi:MAG TPA: hypothetical protein VJZ00_09245, partial [Thermoanaerobaculia bacterium]|nr:hypothetical protein [Thermoanaerobaculia bacterium]
MRRSVHDNLIQFLRRRQELFPFRRDLDIRQFLGDTIGRSADLCPTPAKIFLLDEIEPDGYGFPLNRTPALDELGTRFQRWLDEHLEQRGNGGDRAQDIFNGYLNFVVKLARNAIEASVLADYSAVFWLLHSQQVAQLFTGFVRRASTSGISREEVDRLKYSLHAKWIRAIGDALPQKGFLTLLVENPLLSAEEFVSPDLRELRGYVTAVMRRDHNEVRSAFESLRERATSLLQRDRLLRRAIELLGYADKTELPILALLDPRVR